MPFSIEWYIPQRVILCRIIGDVSLDEAQQMADTMAVRITEGIAPVHTIFEASQMGSFPTSIAQLNRMSRWVYHPSTGWIVSINTGRIMSFVAVVLTNTAGVKYRPAASIDDAIKLLQRNDASLPAAQS